MNLRETDLKERNSIKATIIMKGNPLPPMKRSKNHDESTIKRKRK
jgi:hypothetical protein